MSISARNSKKENSVGDGVFLNSLMEAAAHTWNKTWPDQDFLKLLFGMVMSFFQLFKIMAKQNAIYSMYDTSPTFQIRLRPLNWLRH